MAINLAQAKAHLRVYVPDEDADIQLKLDAAVLTAGQFMNRRIFPDADSLTAARLNVPTALADATQARNTALTNADLVDDHDERQVLIDAARAQYRAAFTAAREVLNGIVSNSQIDSAVLLILGHLYSNREDVVIGVSATDLPSGARCLLQPFRVEMGV